MNRSSLSRAYRSADLAPYTPRPHVRENPWVVGAVVALCVVALLFLAYAFAGMTEVAW